MPSTIAPAIDEDSVRETLTDKEKVRNLLKDPEQFVNWVNESIKARQAADPGLMDQVKEQSEKFLRDWLKDSENAEVKSVAKRLNLAEGASSPIRAAKGTLYNPKALGAPHDDLFDQPADFFHSISDRSNKTAELSTKLHTLSNAMSSIKPADGGFLVPEVLRAELLRIALEKAIVRSRARVIPMDSATVPFPMVDSTSNVGSVFGGITGFWTEEGATLTESHPSFGRIKLEAHKLTLYTEVPNELLMDALQALEALINQIFPEALAWFEDISFFIGGGVGEPLGFLNAPANVKVDRATNNQIAWADIANMYARMLPGSLDRAVWVASPDIMPQLLQMTIGGTTPIVWLGGDNFPTAAAAPRLSILGVPMIVSEKARALGSAGDLNLVDFGYYLIGDRQAMSARQSEDFKFDEDKTAFRVIERLDGRPWLQSAITPQNNGNTLSPFVQLDA